MKNGVSAALLLPLMMVVQSPAQAARTTYARVSIAAAPSLTDTLSSLSLVSTKTREQINVSCAALWPALFRREAWMKNYAVARIRTVKGEVGHTGHLAEVTMGSGATQHSRMEEVLDAIPTQRLVIALKDTAAGGVAFAIYDLRAERAHRCDLHFQVMVAALPPASGDLETFSREIKRTTEEQIRSGHRQLKLYVERGYRLAP